MVQLPQTNSTNSYARQLLTKSKPAEGTAIIAYEQTHGRGQFGNNWQTEPGANLTLSVITYPTFGKVTEQFDLSRVVALAVHATLEHYLAETAYIKWPNDIYSSDKKLAGILIENVLQGNTIAESIWGIGLNVNQTVFPADLQKASSMALQSNKSFHLNEVFHQLMGQLEYWYLALRQGQVARIRAAYLDRLYQYHDIKNYIIDGKPRSGMIMGVSPDGQLQVSIDGTLRHFQFKEIEYL